MIKIIADVWNGNKSCKNPISSIEQTNQSLMIGLDIHLNDDTNEQDYSRM
jgi:hypothetical protein